MCGPHRSGSGGMFVTAWLSEFLTVWPLVLPACLPDLGAVALWPCLPASMTTDPAGLLQRACQRPAGPALPVLLRLPALLLGGPRLRALLRHQRGVQPAGAGVDRGLPHGVHHRGRAHLHDAARYDHHHPTPRQATPMPARRHKHESEDGAHLLRACLPACLPACVLPPTK